MGHLPGRADTQDQIAEIGNEAGRPDAAKGRFAERSKRAASGGQHRVAAFRTCVAYTGHSCPQLSIRIGHYRHRQTNVCPTYYQNSAPMFSRGPNRLNPPAVPGNPRPSRLFVTLKTRAGHLANSIIAEAFFELSMQTSGKRESLL